MADDLLGAPLAAQQLVYQREVLRAEAAVAARAVAAAVRPLIGSEGAVAAVGAGGVAAQLAADGRAVAASRPRDLGLVEPF